MGLWKDVVINFVHSKCLLAHDISNSLLIKGLYLDVGYSYERFARYLIAK